jgi:uncharacterized membrane protein YccF (DUF307 family)
MIDPQLAGVLRLLFNLFWVVLGGFWMALLWCLVGLLCIVTIIFIPWARACFTIAGFTLWPFGRVAISRAVLTGQDDIGTGTLGLIGNLVWLVLAGFWLALAHLAVAVINAVTIIGIPFAWQHVKLAGIALAPIGMTVVPVEVAEAARGRFPQ